MRWNVKYQTKTIKLPTPGGGEEWVSRYERAERAGPKALSELPEEPEIPECAMHIWEWFWTLHSRRQSGFESPQPLTYSEINAWVTLTRTPVFPQEIDALIQMDSAFLSQQAENRAKQREAK